MEGVEEGVVSLFYFVDMRELMEGVEEVVEDLWE